MAVVQIFEPVPLGAAVCEDPAAERLVGAARLFARAGLTPSYGAGDHGNFSCRMKKGFLMTGRETQKASLKTDQLVRVTGWERPASGRARVFYEGRAVPSTDALLHASIYEARPDVSAILHGHEDRLLKEAEALGLAVTRLSARVNSPELVGDVCELCAGSDFLILRDHGFISLGRDVAQAVGRAWSWLGRLRRDLPDPGLPGAAKTGLWPEAAACRRRARRG